MDKQKPDISLYGLPFAVSEFNNMPYRPLGQSGLKASVIGLGTWKFGYPETGDCSRVNEKSAFEILDRAYELGVTFWDTANRYNASSGNSERTIGSWLSQNTKIRRDIVLATKLGGLMDGRTPNHCGLSRQNIKESVYASLERLRTDTIDLLYFHRPDDSVLAEESILAIDDLIRMDLVRYFAVSNFSVTQLKQYQQTMDRIGPSLRARICAVQNSFNLIDGENPEQAGVLKYCAENNLSFIAWSPLAEGLLTDRYLQTDFVGEGDRLYDQKNDRYLDPDIQRILKGLGEQAKKKGITLAQLVLAYLLTLPGMGPVIPSVSNLSQLEENAKVRQISLTPDDCEMIQKLTLNL